MNKEHCDGQWCNFCQQNPGKRLGVCWMLDGMVTAEPEKPEKAGRHRGEESEDDDA